MNPVSFAKAPPGIIQYFFFILASKYLVPGNDHAYDILW